tara:strand:+ start:9887 stop:10366 length:480 start_codon:yes stop_codon:yes gene_type:complete
MIEVVIIIIFLVYTYYYRSIFQAYGIIELFKSRFIGFLFAFLLLYILRKRIFKEFFNVLNTDNRILNKNIIEEFQFLRQIKHLTNNNNRLNDYHKKCVKILVLKQEWNCSMCGGQLNNNNYNIDYKTPFTMGGEDSFENMQLLCTNCYKNKIAIENYLK